METGEQNLRKVLGLSDVLGFVFGCILGAGVLVMTGVGIGLTGKGVVIAFLIAGVMNCICVMPMAQLTSALPTTGASYRYSSLLCGPKWGGLWQVGIILSKVTIGLYALSFAQYLLVMYPGAPLKLSAVAMITFFYVLNLVGVKSAATTQKILVVLKISGLAVFAFIGITYVDLPTYFSNTAELIPNGVDGMLQAIGLVAFASYGGVTVAEMGGEMKNPSRDIPLGIIVGTIGSTLIYMIISFVAAGVLPIDQVANKPLNLVGQVVLPPAAYYYFMMAGVVVALGTCMNSIFQWVTRGLIVSSQDGWLPAQLGAVNKRFGTPHYALTFFYVIGVITLLSDISLGNIARIGFGLLLLVNIIPVFGALNLVKKYPIQYEHALFKLKPSTLRATTIFSLFLMFGQVFYVLKGLPMDLLIGFIAACIAAGAYVQVVGSRIDLQRISETKI